ncbi:DEAD/DEAH box helicase [Helicobacter sp. MIT 14-3879]|uniref:DEAD/DEAH box helicase n=1 Tax=Helicobacter sp. MIT 14-3879 TaxID=2040649 RepID=UPI000E1EFD20|nr:DEAD/DEAH box helicase family protein [Helicobacter sp. MIT 14-3879]RDU60588.1 hypothetical protein CQA44_10425 [Helicobacter sp. MIT 14-3879]
MTQAVIDLQKEVIQKLLEAFENKNEITLKAPTGSGKTYMMAAFMERVLKRDSRAIFIVSSLSKGALGEQNFKAFQRFSKDFKHLKPYLIESQNIGENALFIPLEYNVYVLPRDLYKEKSKLKQGAFVGFLRSQREGEEFKPIQEKKIYLIKDECHIATNNLDDLIIRDYRDTNRKYFSKVINISATPKLTKGQIPDVELSEAEAVTARLIKAVEYDEEERKLEEGLSLALERFLNLKREYLKLGINPCFIIQISNKQRADEEIKRIKKILSQVEFSSLKWMYIVDDKNSSDSNDELKAKKLPLKKWKNYARENTSTIDIIIFKMVISEGWDIPRACMLYQMRDSKSRQLDEQVIGRVRRNPCLLEFESLSKREQELITKAYVYGIKPKNEGSIAVRLQGERGQGEEGLFTNLIQEELKIHTTRLKRITTTKKLEVEKILENETESKKDIFSLYAQLKTHKELQKECYHYMLGADDERERVQRWFAFNNHFKAIKKQCDILMQDYEENIELEPLESVLPFESIVSKSAYEMSGLGRWIWQRLDRESSFYFDSKSELEWLNFLMDLREENAPNKEGSKQGKLIKSIAINTEDIYLLGKNFPFRSCLKFEYYLEGYHFSYPDFILKDWRDRIHLFEVKSLNIAKNMNIDNREYEAKIQALKQCYKAVASKTGYHFYLPMKKGKSWDIWYAGNLYTKQSLTKDMLRDMLKKPN